MKKFAAGRKGEQLLQSRPFFGVLEYISISNFYSFLLKNVWPHDRCVLCIAEVDRWRGRNVVTTSTGGSEGGAASFERRQQ